MIVKEFIESKNIGNLDDKLITEYSKNEKLVKQLFIGKVSEIIGFDKTVELLKEATSEINKI